jgi:hypothetical protein
MVSSRSPRHCILLLAIVAMASPALAQEMDETLLVEDTFFREWTLSYQPPSINEWSYHEATVIQLPPPSQKNIVEMERWSAGVSMAATETEATVTPLREARFMHYLSHLDLAVGWQTADNRRETNGPFMLAIGRLAHQDNFWTLTAYAMQHQLEDEAANKLSVTRIGGKVGIWAMETLEVGGFAESNETVLRTTVQPRIAAEQVGAGVYFKYVGKVGDTRFVNIAGSAALVEFNKYPPTIVLDQGAPAGTAPTQVKDEVNFRGTLEADFYLTPRISFGGGVIVEKGDNSIAEGFTIMARGQYNFNSYIGVDVAFARHSPDEALLDDETSLIVTAILRD